MGSQLSSTPANRRNSSSLDPGLASDGVYRSSEGVPVFHEVRAPSIDELRALLGRIIKRIMKLLTRTGYLIEEQGMSYLAEADSDSALTPLQLAACTYRIALGPRAGQKVLSLQTVPSRPADSTQPGCVNAHGFERACGGALWRPSAQGTRTPVPLYHPPGDCQRTAQA